MRIAKHNSVGEYSLSPDINSMVANAEAMGYVIIDNTRTILEKNFLFCKILDLTDGEAIIGKKIDTILAELTLKDAREEEAYTSCLLYTSPSPRDRTRSRMPSSA